MSVTENNDELCMLGICSNAHKQYTPIACFAAGPATCHFSEEQIDISDPLVKQASPQDFSKL